MVLSTFFNPRNGGHWAVKSVNNFAQSYNLYLSIWTTLFSEISNALLQVRSYYSAQNVTDVALYTEPEEIYLMKKNGSLKNCSADLLT